MTLFDRLGIYLNTPSNHLPIYIGLGVYLVVILYLAGSYTPVPVLQP